MNNIELYQNIKESVGATWMPNLEKESLSVKTESVDKSQVWEKISAFKPSAGWIQTLDATGLLQDFDIDEQVNNPQSGQQVLCAELMNELGRSLHIRQVNRVGMLFLTFSEGDEECYFTEAKHQIKSKRHKGTATYCSYWSMNEASRQPKFSRLISMDLKG